LNRGLKKDMVCANCVVATVPEEESLASSGRASRSASHSDVHRFKYLQNDTMIHNLLCTI